MFNFQKEVILNSVAETVDLTNKAADGKVHVKMHADYDPTKVLDKVLYVTRPVEGQCAKITFNSANLQNAVGGSHFQILIELGLDNDYRGDYGSALYYFRKPILADLATTNTDADSLVKAFNTVVPTNYKFVSAEKEGDNCVVTAADSAIKIRNVEFIGFVCDTRCEGQSEERVIMGSMEDTDVKINNVVVATVESNSVEYGTYNYLIQNLRLPTYENLRFNSPAAVEIPNKGVNYAQVSFGYEVRRNHTFGGVSVAGQVNTSMTLHTFYIPEDEVDTFTGLFTGCTVQEMTRGNSTPEGASEVQILTNSKASVSDL